MPQTVSDAITAIQKGEIIVVTDDDDRENEGDLICAASLCTSEKMAFIVRHTSGIVCTPLPRDEAVRLHLAPMVAANDAPLGTAFTVSVDCRHGLTTGISAEERNNTVRALANANMGASDFVRPGHVFPLIARDGGVLMRSGHTEAAVDLCRLAGLPPIGVICELVNDDGSVMRGQKVADFAREHNLKHVSIADLISWRQAREKLVDKVSSFPVPSEWGQFTGHAYVTPFEPVHHFAFVYGDVSDGKNILVRLHRANVVSDLFGKNRSVEAALKRIVKEGRGILIYLRDGTAGVPLSTLKEDETHSELSRTRQWREVGLGAQILKDLSVVSIRNLATSSRSYVGLSGFGIELIGDEVLES